MVQAGPPRLVLVALALLLAQAAALDAPRTHHVERSQEGTSYLPVVLWHGMGDSCCAERSIGSIQALLEKELPGVYVHSLATGRGPLLDVLYSYFGFVNDQVAAVCDELLGLQQLQGGYVAVGFSQGGQFLRAVAQRCQHLGPRMHTLVTMGGQHQGVANVPGCWEPPQAAQGGAQGGSGGGGSTTPSILCKMMQGLVGRGAYNWFAQRHVVQAQYVKDPYQLEAYLARSAFLADINNEVPASRKRRYRDNLASLQRLVLVLFEQDDMVVPRESSHFGFFNGSGVQAMQETALYQEDWIGLRQLQEGGRLALERAPGRHMQFSSSWFAEHIIRPYLAVPAGAATGGAAAAADA